MGNDKQPSSSLGWIADIEKTTIDNTNFRTVLFTARHIQLTVMSLAVGEQHRLGDARQPRPVPADRSSSGTAAARLVVGRRGRGARRLDDGLGR
ncbi:MAG: hypothetical protein WKF58_07500 [Ilumatobacteraceae bacterium]